MDLFISRWLFCSSEKLESWNDDLIFGLRSQLVAMFCKVYFDMLHQRSFLNSNCPGRTLTGVSDLNCGHVNPCVDVDVEDDARIPPISLKKK